MNVIENCKLKTNNDSIRAGRVNYLIDRSIDRYTFAYIYIRYMNRSRLERNKRKRRAGK